MDRHDLTVFNIGYQGRSITKLCTALRDAGVKVLVDVRIAAWSQRPEYRKTALGLALEQHGVEYVHCKAAGNPFRHQADQWQECEVLYKGHLKEHPEVLGELEQLILNKPAALLCYEALRSECHRGVLLARLKRRLKLSVVDL